MSKQQVAGGTPLHRAEAVLGKVLWVELCKLGVPSYVAGAGELKALLGIHDQYERWLEESVRVLVGHGYLRAAEGGGYATVGVAITAEDAWSEWEEYFAAWKSDATLGGQLALVDKTLRSLRDILNGVVPATDVLFPNGSMALVERAY